MYNLMRAQRECFEEANMITVIVHHYAVPDLVSRAESGIKENGRVMRSFPGFISRQTLYAQDDRNQITSVTTWRSLDDFQGWSNRPDRPAPNPDAPSLWSRPVESTVFDLTPEL